MAAKPKKKQEQSNIDTSGDTFNHTGKIKLVYHEPIRIKMVQQANKNPALATLLAQYETDDWGGIIGELAATFNMEMDGAYSQADLDNIAQDLYWRLVELNKITVVDVALAGKNDIIQ